MAAIAATDVPARQEAGGQLSRKGARTRERLLDAAKSVFETDGFLDSRISDITDQAGLSHGSFYYYFDSKEEAFREVAKRVDEHLGAPLADVILDPSSTGSPQDRIREAIRRYFESYRAEARIMGIIEQVSRYDDHVHDLRLEQHVSYRRQVASSIRRLQENGLADAALDPLVVAAAMGALTDRFAEMWLVEGSVECGFDEGVEQVARVFINALGLDGDRRVAS